MRARVVVPHVDPDRRIGSEIDDAPLRIIRVGVVSIVGFEQDGIIVAALKAVAVHVKELVSRCVDKLIHDEIIGRCGRGRGLRIVRHRSAEIVVLAGVVVEWRWQGCGSRDGCVRSVVHEDDGAAFGLVRAGAEAAGLQGTHPDGIVAGLGGEEDIGALADLWVEDVSKGSQAGAGLWIEEEDRRLM